MQKETPNRVWENENGIKYHELFTVMAETRFFFYLSRIECFDSSICIHSLTIPCSARYLIVHLHFIKNFICEIKTVSHFLVVNRFLHWQRWRARTKYLVFGA